VKVIISTDSPLSAVAYNQNDGTIFTFSPAGAEELYATLAKMLHPNTDGSLSTKLWNELRREYHTLLLMPDDHPQRTRQAGIIVGLGTAVATIRGSTFAQVLQHIKDAARPGEMETQLHEGTQ
jgi:hypothetical protein